MADTRTTPSAKTPRKTTKAQRRTRRPKLSAEGEALLKDANDASSAARNAWLAFLALIAYLLVTLAGVTHKDLLLNDPVTLPIVNVEIPLFSFFQFAPVLLLLVLLSTLIQHVMLARKYRTFVETITPYEQKAGAEHPARELVHSYVVAQFLAGPKRNIVMNWLMRLMVFVTFAVLPVLTLLYFQIKFIPYHDVWITYGHRIAALLGLLLLFTLLPIIQLQPRKRVFKIGPQAESWRVSRLGIVLGAITAILVVGFSWLIATVPDEKIDQLLGFSAPGTQRSDEALLNPFVQFVLKRMPELDLGPEGWLPAWLISHRVLIVEDEDLVPDKDDEHSEVSQVLRGRNLQYARLNRSDLHRADLTKADLRGAEMVGTRLDKAGLRESKLQAANLEHASLQGADLRLTGLHGANLEKAELQGANCFMANLQGADLRKANLQGANLERARLLGADLSFAGPQGADLSGAELQGADLSYAELQGADLWPAEPDSSSIDTSSDTLPAAKLPKTASLFMGFSWTKLQGADLSNVKVWLSSLIFDDERPLPLNLAELDMSPLTKEAKAELEHSLRAKISDPHLFSRVRARLDLILRDAPPRWDDEDNWKNARRAGESPVDAVVAYLLGIACGDPDGHIANMMAKRAYYTRIRDFDLDPLGQSLANALLDEECQGAKALSKVARAKLKEFVARKEW